MTKFVLGKNKLLQYIQEKKTKKINYNINIQMWMYFTSYYYYSLQPVNNYTIDYSIVWYVGIEWSLTSEYSVFIDLFWL